MVFPVDDADVVVRMSVRGGETYDLNTINILI